MLTIAQNSQLILWEKSTGNKLGFYIHPDFDDSTASNSPDLVDLVVINSGRYMALY
jgi:hypothetical protein